MSFDDLIQSVGKRNNIDQLEKKDDRYHITIDGHIELTCFQNAGKFYLHAILAQLPESSIDQEKILQTLLKKQYGLLSSQKTSLCIEPNSTLLAINSIRPSNHLTEDIIEEAIEELVNNYEYYLSLIQEMSLNNKGISNTPIMIMP